MKGIYMNLSQISDGQLTSEYVKRFTIQSGETISDNDAAVAHLRPYFSDPLREMFVVIFLNGKNAHITTEVIFKGSLTNAFVHPREIVRKAVLIGAAALILAHNHPSGNPEPSTEDIQITKKLMMACKTIDVPIHDHIILAGINNTSLANRGLI